ncbi:heme ABC transporter ATP-binding protein [Desulfosarcina ovata subsp. sediminis]|uniref:Heme ABC transporter ATP-binding protein n=1 Tax=Desulfosarcina ovata subsp. sediminis TaxID=885957 RepID=A0A5K7ZTB7_9BACT|nr:ABC transporter ATP-binding protein [Desulfosarcina ovata]BBO83440.1 heme ABC transporter ATP-binding protein [Desulfosarcina ovata subsp. sediminis]
MNKIETLEMKEISKSFQGVRANDGISLKISSGEILGLLGENGAGKTTLMNILYGIYQPDGGEIRINGRRVSIDSPRDSIEQGIGMVHQHFMLVQNHTVIENLALGYIRSPMWFPQKKLRQRIATFSNKFNFDVDPDKKVWQLSAGEQQRVEIVKALVNGAGLLILDEPTSVLTPQETRDFFQILEKMRRDGQMIILISHKLDEIKKLCDRVTVLRKGRIVGHADTKDLDKRSMAKMMIGRDVIFSFSREALPRKEKVLDVSDVTVDGDKGFPVVNGISFDVYRNEIFGIAGVSGNGQRELVEAITGLRTVSRGRIRINGVDITNRSPRKIHNTGVSHVPEERIRFGIAPNLFLYENAILKQHHQKKFSSRLFLAYGRIKAHTRKLIEEFQVATPSINIQTKNLSGGNIQKLILGREIAGNPDLLVASHPTYGLDVGATEYLRNQLLKRRAEGGAILLVSEDLDEIFELCDRIAVIFQGRFMGVLESDDSRLSDIGLMMAGTTHLTTGEGADGSF